MGDDDDGNNSRSRAITIASRAFAALTFLAVFATSAAASAKCDEERLKPPKSLLDLPGLIGLYAMLGPASGSTGDGARGGVTVAARIDLRPGPLWMSTGARVLPRGLSVVDASFGLDARAFRNVSCFQSGDDGDSDSRAIVDVQRVLFVGIHRLSGAPDGTHRSFEMGWIYRMHRALRTGWIDAWDLRLSVLLDGTEHGLHGNLSYSFAPREVPIPLYIGIEAGTLAGTRWLTLDLGVALDVPSNRQSRRYEEHTARTRLILPGAIDSSARL